MHRSSHGARRAAPTISLPEDLLAALGAHGVEPSPADLALPKALAPHVVSVCQLWLTALDTIRDHGECLLASCDLAAAEADTQALLAAALQLPPEAERLAVRDAVLGCVEQHLGGLRAAARLQGCAISAPLWAAFLRQCGAPPASPGGATLGHFLAAQPLRHRPALERLLAAAGRHGRLAAELAALTERWAATLPLVIAESGAYRLDKACVTRAVADLRRSVSSLAVLATDPHAGGLLDALQARQATLTVAASLLEQWACLAQELPRVCAVVAQPLLQRLFVRLLSESKWADVQQDVEGAQSQWQELLAAMHGSFVPLASAERQAVVAERLASIAAVTAAVQRYVGDVFARKRAAWPRLWLLSDEELLGWLTLPAAPELPPLAARLLPGVAGLRVAGGAVGAVVSPSGEVVALPAPVAVEGAMDEFLRLLHRELDYAMQRALTTVAGDVADILPYPDPLPALRVALPAWLGALPAQAVAAGLRLLWTEWVEGALGAARPLSAPPQRPASAFAPGGHSGHSQMKSPRLDFFSAAQPDPVHAWAAQRSPEGKRRPPPINTGSRTPPRRPSLMAVKTLRVVDLEPRHSLPAGPRSRPGVRPGKEATGQRIAALCALLMELRRTTSAVVQGHTLEALISEHVQLRQQWEEELRSLRSPLDFGWRRRLRCYWDAAAQRCMVWVGDVAVPHGTELLPQRPFPALTAETQHAHFVLAQAFGGLATLSTVVGHPPLHGEDVARDFALLAGHPAVAVDVAPEWDRPAFSAAVGPALRSGGLLVLRDVRHLPAALVGDLAGLLEDLAATRMDPGHVVGLLGGRPARTACLVGALDVTPALPPLLAPPAAGHAAYMPASLKEMLLTVTINAPDLQSVAGLHLAAQGFGSHAALARRLATLFAWAGRQLPAAPPAVWGAAMARAVARAAGQWRRDHPEVEEAVCVAQGLRSKVRWLLSPPEASEFDRLAALLLPDYAPAAATAYLRLELAVAEAAAHYGLPRHEAFEARCLQLYAMCGAQRCVVLAGGPGSGKSTAQAILRHALAAVLHCAYHEHRLSPALFTAAQLFGGPDPAGVAREGLLPFLYATASERQQASVHSPTPAPAQTWICFDGALPQAFLDALGPAPPPGLVPHADPATVLGAPPGVQLLLELHSLEHLTPHMIAGFGVLHFPEPESAVLLRTLQQRVDLKLQPLHTAYLAPVLEEAAEPLHHYLTVHCSLRQPLGQCIAAAHHYFNAMARELIVCPNPTHTGRYVAWFCVAWAFCGTLCSRHRRRAHHFLRQHVVLPEKDTIFDYFVDTCTSEMKLWRDVASRVSLAESTLLVPTLDACRYAYLLGLLAAEGQHVLLTGPPCSSKSGLLRGFAQSRRLPHNATALTPAAGPELLHAKLEALFPRRGAGLAPKDGGAFFLLVDDVHYGPDAAREAVRALMLSGQALPGYWARHRPPGPGWGFTAVERVRFLMAATHGAAPLGALVGRACHIEIDMPCDTSMEQHVCRTLLLSYPDEPLLGIEAVARWTVSLFTRLQAHPPSRLCVDLRCVDRVVRAVAAAHPSIGPNFGRLLELWQYCCQRTVGDRLAPSNLAGHELLAAVMAEAGAKPAAPAVHVLNVNAGTASSADHQAVPRPDAHAVLRSRTLGLPAARYVATGPTAELVLRASRALELEGGHFAVVGPPGSGRSTAITWALARLNCTLGPWQASVAEACAAGDHGRFRRALKAAHAAAREGRSAAVVLDLDVLPAPWLPDVSSWLSAGRVPGLLPSDAKATRHLHFAVLAPSWAALAAAPTLQSHCEVSPVLSWQEADYLQLLQTVWPDATTVDTETVAAVHAALANSFAEYAAGGRPPSLPLRCLANLCRMYDHLRLCRMDALAQELSRCTEAAGLLEPLQAGGPLLQTPGAGRPERDAAGDTDAARLPAAVARYQQRLAAEADALRARQATANVDSLLAAALLCYGGPLDVAGRRQLLATVGGVLRRHFGASTAPPSLKALLGLVVGGQRPLLSFVRNQSTAGLLTTELTMVSAAILAHACGGVYVIDADALLAPWLQRTRPAVAVLPWDAATTPTVLRDAARHGRTVALTELDPTTAPPLLLWPLLDLAFPLLAGRRSVVFAGDEVEVDPQFRLLVVGTRPPAEQWYKHATVVDCSLAGASAEEVFGALLTPAAPWDGEHATHLEARLDDAEDRLTRETQRLGTLVAAAQHQRCPTTAGRLLRALAAVEAAAAGVAEARAAVDRDPPLGKDVAIAAARLARIWAVAQGVRHAAPRALPVPFARVQSLLRVHAAPKDKFAEKPTAQPAILIQHLLRAAAPDAKLPLGYGLALALEWPGSWPPADLPLLSHGPPPAPAGPVEGGGAGVAPSWLPRGVWPRLVALVHQWPGLKGLLESLDRKDRQWKLWWASWSMTSRQPDLETASRLEKLLLVRLLRPDRAFPAMLAFTHTFLAQEVGPQYRQDKVPEYARAVLADATPDHPLVIHQTPGTDLLPDFLAAVPPRGKGRPEVAVHVLGPDVPADDAIVTVRTAAADGGWVFWQAARGGCAASNKAVLDTVAGVLAGAELHPEFHFVAVTEDGVEELAPALRDVITLIATPGPKGMRQRLLAAFRHLGEERFQALPPAGRTVLFAAALHLAAAQERLPFTPVHLANSISAAVQPSTPLPDFTLLAHVSQQLVASTANTGAMSTILWGALQHLLHQRCPAAGGPFPPAPGAWASSPASPPRAAPWAAGRPPRGDTLEDYLRSLALRLPPSDPLSALGLPPSADLHFAAQQAARLDDFVTQCYAGPAPAEPPPAARALLHRAALDVLQRLQPGCSALSDGPAQPGQAVHRFFEREMEHYAHEVAQVRAEVAALILTLDSGHSVAGHALACLGHGGLPVQWGALAFPGATLEQWLCAMEFRHRQLHAGLRSPVAAVWWGALHAPAALLEALRQDVAERRRGEAGWEADRLAVYVALPPGPLFPDRPALRLLGLQADGFALDADGRVSEAPDPLQDWAGQPTTPLPEAVAVVVPGDLLPPASRLWQCPVYDNPVRCRLLTHLPLPVDGTPEGWDLRQACLYAACAPYPLPVPAMHLHPHHRPGVAGAGGGAEDVLSLEAAAPHADALRVDVHCGAARADVLVLCFLLGPDGFLLPDEPLSADNPSDKGKTVWLEDHAIGICLCFGLTTLARRIHGLALILAVKDRLSTRLRAIPGLAVSLRDAAEGTVLCHRPVGRHISSRATSAQLCLVRRSGTDLLYDGHVAGYQCDPYQLAVLYQPPYHSPRTALDRYERFSVSRAAPTCSALSIEMQWEGVQPPTVTAVAIGTDEHGSLLSPQHVVRASGPTHPAVLVSEPSPDVSRFDLDLEALLDADVAAVQLYHLLPSMQGLPGCSALALRLLARRPQEQVLCTAHLDFPAGSLNTCLSVGRMAWTGDAWYFNLCGDTDALTLDQLCDLLTDANQDAALRDLSASAVPFGDLREFSRFQTDVREFSRWQSDAPDHQRFLSGPWHASL